MMAKKFGTVVKIKKVRIVTSHGALAERLKEAAQALSDRADELARSSRIEEARNLSGLVGAVREAAKIVVKYRPRTAQARNVRHRKAKTTKDTVLEQAETLKKKRPGLSKAGVAKLIASKSPAPCGFDQAKKYLDQRWNRTAWAALGSAVP